MMIKPLSTKHINVTGDVQPKRNASGLVTFIRNIGILFAGVVLAIVAFSTYWVFSNSDVITKAILNPEEVRAIYKECKIEKVYLVK